MEIKEITDKEIWENFLLRYREKTFLDSWNWGEFQKKEGNKIWRLGAYKNQGLVAVSLAILTKAKRGSFLFIPHGPVGKKESLKDLLEKLKETSKKEKLSFIRIAPVWEKDSSYIFKDLGFVNSPTFIHPELTWELDIGEEDLLKKMRKTTRYLIRQAEKNNDIEIVKSSDIDDLDKFYDLYKKTFKRHSFVPFSLDYLKNQFSSFSPDNEILIFLGKYRGEVVSSAIIIFWQNTAFYHHGASLPLKIPVSYLLQWEAIKEAKIRGCSKYNFWGIALKKSNIKIDNPKSLLDKNHPWYGLSLFKMGFGGYLKEYIRTQDLVLSRSYYLTYIIETIRRIKRGL